MEDFLMKATGVAITAVALAVIGSFAFRLHDAWISSQQATQGAS